MQLIYEATQNSDRTEGKGIPVTIGFFSNIEDAVMAVKGRGVKGIGDGEVYEVILSATFLEFNLKDKLNGRTYKRLVYGWRRNLVGEWGHGYVDNRDAPTSDKEFQDFVKLYKKLKERYGSALDKTLRTRTSS